MNSVEEIEYKETQALVQTLYHHLITLAASLKGRLSPVEEDTLANLFQVQMNLQILLSEIFPRAKPLSSTSSSSLFVSAQAESLETKPEVGLEGLSPATQAEAASSAQIDSIAYAQAIQYARDLVKAMRQKKEHQRRLELTSQQLIRAEKLATVGQVAATVAHELGNILTPLLMYAKLIYKETAGDERSDVAEFATQISEIANRASNMLRQLLDASRSESAMMVSVDLIQVINSALALLTPRFNKQVINVEQRYPDNLPVVIGNPDQLEQVFINVALNACDAMSNGGDFTITLKLGNGQITPMPTADFITIRLSDTGRGIPAENIGTLFEPFFTTKTQGAGSGLGLFVSYMIINQHHGTIEVESELGVGTTFIIKLPIVGKEET